jgi:hypothetical protein
MGEQEFNLGLPQEILDGLKSTLEELGFAVAEEEIIDRVSWSFRTRITNLKRGAEIVNIAHFSRETINVDSPELDDLRSMAFLEYCLPKERSLIIMSEGLDALSTKVERIIDNWKLRQMNVRFIPWRRIDELPPPSVADRAPELARMLDIELPPSMRYERPTRAGYKKLAPKDEEEIARIMEPLAATYMAGGPEQFFRNLIERTRLPSDWKSELLTGSISGAMPNVYARQIVQWAIHRGLFTPEGESGELTVLGEIIESLTQDCGNNEKRQLLQITERYDLLDELAVRRLQSN